MIAFVGSVFSPYYAWAGRTDPEDHVCINVCLYGPRGNRWMMTERGRGALERGPDFFRVGPSALRREDDGDGLVLDFDETATPWPSANWRPQRIRGRVRFAPDFLTRARYDLTPGGAHVWRPYAPSGRIAVDVEGGPRWSGSGYLDGNWGAEGLEQGFARWDWARGRIGGEAVVLYDMERRDGTRHGLALRFPGPEPESFPPPERRRLRRGIWGVSRALRSETPPALVASLEDGPFYTRALARGRVLGRDAVFMHERFSGVRFASPLVKRMLPFRMPRRV